MSDFKKLQNLYVEYYGQYSDFPSGQYSPNETGTDNGKTNTYRKPIPTSSPDKPSHAMSFQATTPIEAEEDEAISKQFVAKCIKDELKDAESKGMDYCVFVLGKLLQTISRA